MSFDTPQHRPQAELSSPGVFHFGSPNLNRCLDFSPGIPNFYSHNPCNIIHSPGFPNFYKTVQAHSPGVSNFYNQNNQSEDTSSSDTQQSPLKR